MTYFGGLGAGKGWDKFKFVLNPSEFKSVFQDLDYWFVITNTRVPRNYSVQDRDSIFEPYQYYYAKIISGSPWTRKEDWKLETPLRLSITHDPKKIQFQDITDKTGKVSLEFKRVEPIEPVINISPFYLYYLNDKLSVEVLNEEGIFGLELNFPKVVSFADEKFEKIHETGHFPNRILFDKLVTRIKDRSKRAKIASKTKEFKPNFWVSDAALQEINRNSFLVTNSLNLK